ncbi:autotransporter outer membrane beta-barrel domain-containing protein [Phascolarctobacterium faecium]|uniref:autotransporter outer membrane beta-barrel domain-containing protein n=1 Tax=Phascolarctobacterium faecium TaxID=33025 RepID=UPI001D768B4F|nr:autotransporter outer membrane beta-barrel domain-containing protein [Phascolarctobacterium faecium]MBS1331095.1 autotransporter outer membrane beta-barrel domain-containing protein [Acidaminococcaceae bacterium]
MPLKSRVKSLLGEKRKKRAEKVLATVVMGMNLVNVTAPVAALAAAGKTMPAPVQPLRSDAAPLDYAVLPQLADVVDRAIFARAEATDYSGNASVATMVKGDTQTITSGQNGIVSVMSGDVNGAGLQTISSGGTGTVSKMDGGGTQFVSSGGIGTVIDMNGGYQTVYEGGTGKVETMDGLQYISGGVGSVGTMNGPAGQFIYSGGTGMINELNSYQQYVNEGCTGIINIMNTTGTQWISANAVGTVVTLKSGTQLVDDGGTGTIITLDNHDGAGGQIVYSNAIGTIVTMLDGEQYVFKGGSATVVDMSGGTQIVRVSGNGMIETLNGGEQNIMGGGTGLVSTMNSGSQVISSSGTGTVDTLNGGTQTVAGGGNGTVSTMLGGTQVVSRSGKGTVNALNGGTQIVSVGGTSLDTVLNSGGEQLILNGGTALDTELNGGIMQMSSGGIISGMTMTGGSMVLENIDGGSFNINGTLTANNAVIDMTDSSVTRAGTPAYESLTIDTLSGSGTTFILDTDLAGEANSDKVTITHADVGTHYVQIKDLSKLNNIEVTGEHKQLLITDASGKLTFVGKEFNAGGLWDVDPTLSKGDALGLSANDWYLTNMVKTVNNDTSVLLDAADNSYAMWRNTNDSLRSRLGALASGREQADGVWARTQAGRFSGSGYEGRYNLYQLGFEKQFKGGSIYGGAIDYGDGSGSYAPGSSKDNLRSFSLYGIWTTGSGAYTNVTARVGNFSTDLESYGDYPDKASYKQHAYSLSVEYGKRFDFEAGFFVEPQAQFTLGRLAGIDYTTDRGVTGRIDGMNSAIGRIGFVMGQKIENGSDIYLKADLLHEFAGERDLVLTSDAGGTNDILTKHNDYGDTWFELGLGGNVRISKTGNFYGEVTRGFSGDINKKWSVNAGLRFTF